MAMMVIALTIEDGIDSDALLLRAKFWWGVEQKNISAKLLHDFCTKQLSLVRR
jgi:hypothetical protein